MELEDLDWETVGDLVEVEKRIKELEGKPDWAGNHEVHRNS